MFSLSTIYYVNNSMHKGSFPGEIELKKLLKLSPQKDYLENDVRIMKSIILPVTSGQVTCPARKFS